MTCPFDRIKVSAERVLDLFKDKEALAVLALNDAAVHLGQGRFFYLPEFNESTERCLNGLVKLKSVVPNLLYARHLWTEQEIKEYWQQDDASRYLFIQGQLLARLGQVDVIPISLILQDLSVSTLIWPADTTACLVLYGPGPWYKLSEMSDWMEKASKDQAGKTYQISIYQQGSYAKRKSFYVKCGNAIGKTCGTMDIPWKLRDMLQEPDTGEEKYSWINGADVMMVLAIEAMENESEPSSPGGL